MPLSANDWRMSLAVGQKIRYLMDAVTYKSGTIRWLEYADDGVSIDIEFTNGDDVALWLVNIKKPLTE